MSIIFTIKDNDWNSVRQAIQKLASTRLGTVATPTFHGLNLTTLAAGSAVVSSLAFTSATGESLAVTSALISSLGVVSGNIGSFTCTSATFDYVEVTNTLRAGDNVGQGHDVEIMAGQRIYFDGT